MADTSNTASPTFSDNWGHFYSMVPLIGLGTLAIGRWEAAPIFLVAELMYFLFHTRTEHPNHPIQKDYGTLATFLIIAMCIWLILPPMRTPMNLGDILLGNSISGMMDRVTTFLTAFSLHLLSEFIHDERHGVASGSYAAVRKNVGPSAFYVIDRIWIPTIMILFCVVLQTSVRNMNL